MKYVLLLLMLAYLSVAGVLYGRWLKTPRYKGSWVQIEYPSDEAHFVTEKEIEQMVERQPRFVCKGKEFKEVNTLELSHYILEHNPLIKNAICYHAPDSFLHIQIEQRNPILRIKSLVDISDVLGHSTRDCYLDYDGKVMPAGKGTPIRLLLVTGYVREQHLPQLLDFADYLRHHTFWANEIVQIYIKENGDVELVPRIGDHIIALGSFDGYEKKLDNVRRFYTQVMPRVGWNAYHTLSVKFDGQIIGEH